MQKIIDKLTLELQGLERELRIELPREIKAAVAMGDLRENAEYHAALERQTFVKSRIGQLRERLGSLTSMNMSQIPTDAVGLGSKVSLLDLDHDSKVSYELVIPEVADLKLGLISVASPIGRSLLNKQAGDEVSIVTPGGTKNFQILELTTIHDTK